MTLYLLPPKFNYLRHTFKVTYHLAKNYMATLNAH